MADQPAKLACVLAARDAGSKAVVKQRGDKGHKCQFLQLRYEPHAAGCEGSGLRELVQRRRWYTSTRCIGTPMCTPRGTSPTHARMNVPLPSMEMTLVTNPYLTPSTDAIGP